MLLEHAVNSQLYIMNFMFLLFHSVRLNRLQVSLVTLGGGFLEIIRIILSPLSALMIDQVNPLPFVHILVLIE